MTATARMRGHVVRWDGGEWRYLDGAPADDSRPCVECHHPHEPGGPDPCIGYKAGLVSACCGHGGLESAIWMPRPALPPTEGAAP